MFKKFFITGFSLGMLVLLTGCNSNERTLRNQIANNAPIDVEVVIEDMTGRSGIAADYINYFIDIYISEENVSAADFAIYAAELVEIANAAVESIDEIERRRISIRLVETNRSDRPILNWSTNNFDPFIVYQYGHLTGSFDFHLDSDTFYPMLLSTAHELIQYTIIVQELHESMISHFFSDSLYHNTGGTRYSRRLVTEQRINFINRTETTTFSGREHQFSLTTGLEFQGVEIALQLRGHRSVRYFVNDALAVYDFVEAQLQEHEIPLKSLAVRPAGYNMQTLGWQFQNADLTTYQQQLTVVENVVNDPHLLSLAELQATINEHFISILEAEDILLAHLQDVDEIRVSPYWLFGGRTSGYRVATLTTTPTIDEFGVYVRNITNEVIELFDTVLEIDLSFHAGVAHVSVTLPYYVEWQPIRFRAFNTGLTEAPRELRFTSGHFLGHVDDAFIMQIRLRYLPNYIQYLRDAGAWE